MHVSLFYWLVMNRRKRMRSRRFNPYGYSRFKALGPIYMEISAVKTQRFAVSWIFLLLPFKRSTHLAQLDRFAQQRGHWGCLAHPAPDFHPDWQGRGKLLVDSERQHRAIYALHQAYKQWAVRDLRLKRRTVSAETRIEDLTAWLIKTRSLAFGRKTSVMDYQIHNAPIITAEFHDVDAGTTVVYTLESTEILMTILNKKRSVPRVELRSNPVFRIGKKTPAVELSMLNAGTTFDIELPVAWSRLTDQVTESDTLQAYLLK